MSDERPVPVWHASVGDGYEPVQIGDMTYSDEEVLRAGGWVKADIDGFRLGPESLPRRRRKPSVEISTRHNGLAGYTYFANPGWRFEIGKFGDLIPIDKRPAQSAE